MNVIRRFLGAMKLLSNSFFRGRRRWTRWSKRWKIDRRRWQINMMKSPETQTPLLF